MFNFILKYFTTQRTNYVLRDIEHYKKRARLSNVERRELIDSLAGYKTIVLKFQYLLERVINVGSPYNLKKLKDFNDYSKKFIENNGEGMIALAHQAIKRYDFEPGEVPNFGWRGLVAEVRDGKIEFVPEQIDLVDWKEYPSDSAIFIEWISHHQRIIDRDNGLTKGDEKLVSYCVDFN